MSYSWEPYRKVHAEPARNPAAHLSYTVPRPHGWARGGGGSVGPSAKRSGCGHGLLFHKSSDSLELTLPASFSDDGGLNEKQLMQGLNDRFAGYIEKVRQLEQQNRGLETEIVELRQRRCSPSRLAAAFEPELRELRQLLQGMEREKVQVELERESLAGDLQLLKGRCEDEARLRAEMEASARLFGKHAEDSQRSKLALDKKAQALTEEMVFLKSAHQEEVADLFSQLQASQLSVDLKDFAKPDLTAALREIRAQMVGCTSDNLQETEEWFRCRMAALSEAAQINNEALQNRRQEISEYRRQLQTKSVELETARGTKESLEKQLTDLEERHDAELVHFQDIIQQLENELKNSKWEMSHHLREYQDLLNVKMALDVEIASYRKLLEGEETRFGSIGGSFTLPSYTYRQTQSLTHSVYASTKAKGTPTKAVPQYKFVEEIISETTKEVDMAELDDSVLRVISDSGSGEKLEEEESTRQEEDEDKDEATTAEASDEEEAEKSSETKEESAEEEGIESKEERAETKESEKKDMPTKESGIAKAETTKSEEEPSKGKETEEYDTVETKEDEEKENAKIKRESEEEESTEKDSEKQEPTKAKDEDEQQNLKKREAIEEEKTAGSKLDGAVITGKVESKEQEIAEAKEENEVSAKDKTEKQGSTEEAQTEADDAKGESIDEEQGEDHVAQQQEELKGTSQRESSAEVADKNKDQKQVESIVQEPQKAKLERESVPQELAKESENQKVQTSEEGKMSEMSGQVGKPNDQAKEGKCEDKKPKISKKEGKEVNQGKEASTQEEKKDKKESEEKTEQTSEAEKVAAGTPESKSTQSGERSPEALINGLDIKVDKEEMESETDRKMTKTSTEVIQKIAEKTIESKEGISKVSVTSTMKTAVTEEIAKEKISDPRSDSKESK